MALAAATFLLGAARTARSAGQPPVLVVEVRAGGLSLGLVSVPKSGAAEGSRFLFVSNEKRRLDAELISRSHRRVVRLTTGRGEAELTVVTLPEVAATGFGTPMILRSGGERFLVTDPGPGGGVLHLDRGASAAAAARWADEHAPGLLPLAAEARDIVAALRARPQPGLDLPPGYSVQAVPLDADAIDFLTSSMRRPFDSRDVTVSALPAADAEWLLKTRPARREPRRQPSPAVTWNGRVVGGRDEKLGNVTATREENGVGTAVVLGWSHDAAGETLRLDVDGDGVARLSIERGAADRKSVVLTIETVPGGGGDSWLVPWIVEDPKGQRVSSLVPSAPEAEVQRAHSRFLDAATASVWRAGLSGEEAARLLWRWYRLLDSERLRSFVPELSELADLLGFMSPPSFGSGDESAWLGAVRVE